MITKKKFALVSSMIGDEEHHVGQVDTNSAKHIYSKAVELGFSSAPLTNFSKPILQKRRKDR